MTAARSQSCATTGRSCVTSSSASPKSRQSESSSSRIWACTITSSAVVGSSATSTLGLHASAIAIAARWRMPPENSCGKPPPRSPGCRPPRAAPPRAPSRPDRTPSRAARAPRRSAPTVCTGLSAFIAPWKTIASSVQRCGRIVSSPPARMSWPFSSTRPDTHALGGSRPRRPSTLVVLPQPDSPTSPSRSPASRASDTPWTAWSSRPSPRSNQTCRSSSSSRALTAPREPRPTRGRRRKLRAERCATLSRGLSASSIAPPSRLQPRMITATSAPGGTIAHQAPVEIAARSKAFSMIVPERDPARVAQAEERQRRLVEDRDRDRQHRVRDQQRRDLRQHVAGDDPQVPGPERPRPLHVDALAHALHLRADHPRRRRPEQDPDHDHDVEEARAPDRRHDDHQRHVGNDEEVVGDPHQDRVGPAAEVAGGDADGAADHHRDEGRREADHERDPCAPHQQRDHVDAAVVEAERMAPGRVAEDWPDLLVQVVGGEHRREQRREDDPEQDGRPRDRRGPTADRLPDETATRADRRLLDDRAGLAGGDAHRPDPGR